MKIIVYSQWWYWWDYYDDDYNYCEESWGVVYKYIQDDNFNTQKWPEKVLQKRGSIRYKSNIGRGILQIDMMSIYSKEMLRQKKIDMILGDIQDLSNTIENILHLKGFRVPKDSDV
jgi:hypothetical protein